MTCNVSSEMLNRTIPHYTMSIITDSVRVCLQSATLKRVHILTVGRQRSD